MKRGFLWFGSNFRFLSILFFMFCTHAFAWSDTANTSPMTMPDRDVSSQPTSPDNPSMENNSSSDDSSFFSTTKTSTDPTEDSLSTEKPPSSTDDNQ